MAKVPASAAKAKRDDTRIIAVSLIDTQVKFDFGPDKEGEFTYGVTVEDVQHADDDVYVFRCKLNVGKHDDGVEEYRTGLAAAYICGITCSGTIKEAKVAANLYASTTIWTMFVSLFAIVAQQMGTEFPSLPNFPRNIKVEEASSALDA